MFTGLCQQCKFLSFSFSAIPYYDIIACSFSRYSLEGTDFFSIDESSGMISTKLELDRENLERHVFRVLARDSSEFQPLTGTATVTVRVTDVDDNRPVFEAPGSNDFFIPNGVKEGDFILGVSGKKKHLSTSSLIRPTYTISAIIFEKVYCPYCLPPTSGGHAGNKKQDRQTNRALNSKREK